MKNDVFADMLKQSGYDKSESEFIINGFTHGFPIHYNGPVNHRDTSNNLPLKCGTAFDLWEKVMKEVSQKHFAGPFDTIPFDTYVQSPIGLINK